MLPAVGAFGLLALDATAVAGCHARAAVLLILDGFRRAGASRARDRGRAAERRHLGPARERGAHRSLIDGQGDLIVRRDARGRITFVNEAFAPLAGRNRETSLGHPVPLSPVVAARPQRDPRRGRRPRRDEAIETVEGLRWIEWQDVPCAARTWRGRPRSRASAATSRHGAGRARAGRGARRRRGRERGEVPLPRDRHATRSARRSTASSAWPTCCSTPA